MNAVITMEAAIRFVKIVTEVIVANVTLDSSFHWTIIITAKTLTNVLKAMAVVVTAVKTLKERISVHVLKDLRWTARKRTAQIPTSVFWQMVDVRRTATIPREAFIVHAQLV